MKPPDSCTMNIHSTDWSWQLNSFRFHVRFLVLWNLNLTHQIYCEVSAIIIRTSLEKLNGQCNNWRVNYRMLRFVSHVLLNWSNCCKNWSVWWNHEFVWTNYGNLREDRIRVLIPWNKHENLGTIGLTMETYFKLGIMQECVSYTWY